MALISNPGVTVSDDYGNSYTAVYAVIDKFIEYDKRQKVAQFMLVFYKSQADVAAGKKPFKEIAYSIGSDIFDNWFSVGAIQADDDPYERAYLYAVSLPATAEFDPSDWSSDE